MIFNNLPIAPSILRAIEELGYKEPTAIQKEAILPILDGKDIIGCAQTGTGKTAAFAIPILQLIASKSLEKGAVKSLVLVPTRELALQVEECFKDLGKHTPIAILSLFGGVPAQPQITALNKKPEIVIATPGRLLDFLGQKLISIADITTLVLDEADQMLDMGFIHDIKKIFRYLPSKRQTLFFSATMPPPIEHFAKTILYRPIKIEVAVETVAADTVAQWVYFIEQEQKKKLLHALVQEYRNLQTLVFTRTKHGANNLVKYLQKRGIDAAAIHGNKTQKAREKALNDFKQKNISILVATDIAARGIDIAQLPVVINYEIPNVAETYVHRIGRTGRAGETGEAISLCAPQEKGYLINIQKLIGVKIPVKQTEDIKL